MKNELFTEIYIKYHKLVVKKVTDLTGNKELAWEICQNTFVKYYIKQGDGNRDFAKAWLLFTAKNEAIDHIRKLSTQKEILSDMVAYECKSTEDSMVKKMENTDLLVRILSDLENINVGWYQVVEAVCIDGKNQEEAAEHLDITIKVLTNRLYRARKYIRCKYLEEFKEQ